MARRVLLVEDDRMNRLATHQALEKLGYEVVDAGDGREAVEIRATGHFDFVIMDCQLPRMDGFQATAEMRRLESDERWPRTPIIGLSARSLESDKENAITRGMDAYLTKPLRLAELKTAMERCLREP